MSMGPWWRRGELQALMENAIRKIHMWNPIALNMTQVVPEAVADLLGELAALPARGLARAPPRVDRAALRDLALPQLRAAAAALSARVAAYADGVRALERCAPCDTFQPGFRFRADNASFRCLRQRRARA